MSDKIENEIVTRKVTGLSYESMKPAFEARKTRLNPYNMHRPLTPPAKEAMQKSYVGNRFDLLTTYLKAEIDEMNLGLTWGRPFAQALVRYCEPDEHLNEVIRLWNEIEYSPAIAMRDRLLEIMNFPEVPLWGIEGRLNLHVKDANVVFESVTGKFNVFGISFDDGFPTPNDVINKQHQPVFQKTLKFTVYFYLKELESHMTGPILYGSKSVRLLPYSPNITINDMIFAMYKRTIQLMMLIEDDLQGIDFSTMPFHQIRSLIEQTAKTYGQGEE